MSGVLYADAVIYWLDGSTDVAPNPIPVGAQARPFVVRISGERVIPCNVLVFAETGEQAEIRLLAALYECCQKDYHGPGGKLLGNASQWLARNRAHQLIGMLESGEYEISHCEYDVQCISKIQWASNGGVT